MNYRDALEFLEKTKARGSILGLGPIENLMEELGNPQDKLKIIHVAGTNGKGSVSAYLYNILINAGYRVGKFSSPSVFEYLEIFSINNQYISEEDYACCMEEIAAAVRQMDKKGKNLPTSFEIETALAFIYFKMKECDLVIMEVGMGGLLDSTNVIKSPLLSVITSISPDHMAVLGDTLEEIAYNKAGIIKEGCPVVISKQKDAVKNVILQVANEKKSLVYEAGECRNVKMSLDGTFMDYADEDKLNSNIYINGIHTKMLGSFQVENMATAIKAALVLKRLGLFIYEENIINGIINTSWHGRFEKIHEKPDIYFDGGHNEAAALRIKETIEYYFTNRRIIYIIGVLADKDYEKILELTAKRADYIYTITPENTRGLDGRVLREHALKYNKNVTYCESLEYAIDKACHRTCGDDLIFIYGSLSFLGHVKEILL